MDTFSLLPDVASWGLFALLAVTIGSAVWLTRRA
jgi:hypothetical protein